VLRFPHHLSIRRRGSAADTVRMAEIDTEWFTTMLAAKR